ncbi:glycosyltransferase family 2 protein [Phocaeicola vulgatus]|uniref:Glycosyltransferase family 2 protein n=1 Tax=Phocaeicola vulgatus TaxID=821 RepID=A0A395UPH6_PHOVU|nr:glycosyltransferase family A protein [Phocaeicola vulgatus]RGR36532.1 glycosyltransferase family 2 protein [Phocaeicola vulgatus]
MEKVNILYSIIIPHYNIPELLQRCLNSIPDLPSFQVIIVDDCSDGKIVDFRYFPGMERENVKCIFLKERHGAGFARNLGLRYACGKWVLFADADDFFHKDFYNIISAYEKSSYEVVYFDSYSVFSDTLVKTYNREDIFKKYVDTKDENVLLFSGLAGLYATKLKIDKRVLYCCTIRSGSICTQINISNIKARIFVARKFNLILKDNSIDAKYWMNLIGPILSLMRIERRIGGTLLLDYFMHTQWIRIYYDLCDSGSRFIKRLGGVNKDKDMRKLQKEIRL